MEQRIIRSSIKMTQSHKDAATIETVFNKFALFPEDVPIPLAVFELLAPSLVPNATSPAEAKQTVTGSVAVLMKYNLLKVG